MLAVHEYRSPGDVYPFSSSVKLVTVLNSEAGANASTARLESGRYSESFRMAVTASGSLGRRVNTFWSNEGRLAIARISPLRGSMASREDRKSTRLNSSHVAISYAV